MPRRAFNVKASALPTNGKRSVLEIGDSRLYKIREVRALLDQHSRSPFADFLALLLGAHPTEANVLTFANNNPEKWANAVRTFATLTGYHEELEITHNVFALVKTMSDMDLEHQLRDIQSKIGDSHLVDPSLITSPYKRIDSAASAAKRITRRR